MIPSIRRIYGGKVDCVLGCTHGIKHGDSIQVGALEWHVLALPGHTRGGVAYCLRGAEGRDCLMTGDALFCGGRCGAPFEACEGEDHRNLLTILRECGERALLFPGHEYTTEILHAAYQSALEKVQMSPRAPPGRLLAIASAHYSALHRRAHHSGRERTPTVPVSLSEDTMIGSTQWEQLLEHSDILIAALEAKERQDGDASTPTPTPTPTPDDTEVCE